MKHAIRLAIVSIILFCFLPLPIQAEISPLPFENESSIAVSDEHPFGKFHGEVSTKWLPDGRKMELLDTLVFVDPRGEVWDAPKGHIVDGASIPQKAWSLAGGPYSGKYRDASVIHDVACDREDRKWWVVHKVFYEAMRASGVPESEARIKYFAVYNFGPRWGDDTWESRLSEQEYQRLLASPKKRSAYIDELLREGFIDTADNKFTELKQYMRYDLNDDIDDGLEKIDNSFTELKQYMRFDLNNDFSQAMYFLDRYLTVENSMRVLGGLVLLGILINLVSVIRRMWLYALGLLVILFVINSL